MKILKAILLTITILSLCGIIATAVLLFEGVFIGLIFWTSLIGCVIGIMGLNVIVHLELKNTDK